jgi:hypothetical protein
MRIFFQGIGLGSLKVLQKDLVRTEHSGYFLSHESRSDPALVWNEIQGVICGSELSLEEAKGFISRECYEQLSVRKHAAFANHRARLYDLFESYSRLKRERFEYDAADR